MSVRRPDVAIVYDRIRPEERLLFDAFERLGVAAEHRYAPHEVHALSGEGAGDLPAVALQRCVAQTRGLALTRVYEAHGVRVLNGSAVAAACGDKLATSAALGRHGVPTPRTMVAFDHDAALDACDRLGYPVVLKPTVGSWGRMVSRLSDRDAVEAVLEHKRALGGPEHGVIYLQEHVVKPGRDIRAFVVGGRVIAAIERASDHWITNTARGAIASRRELDDDVIDLAGRAAAAVGGGILAVDLVESERGLLVLEVNHTMEFRNSIETTGVDIPAAIARHVLEVLEGGAGARPGPVREAVAAHASVLRAVA